MFVCLAPSGPPVDVVANALNTTSLNFSFALNLTTLNGQLIMFNIYYKRSSSSDSSDEMNLAYVPSDAGPYQIAITELTADQAYSIEITVTNEMGESTRSQSLIARTRAIGK